MQPMEQVGTMALGHVLPYHLPRPLIYALAAIGLVILFRRHVRHMLRRLR